MKILTNRFLWTCLLCLLSISLTYASASSQKHDYHYPEKIIITKTPVILTNVVVKEKLRLALTPIKKIKDKPKKGKYAGGKRRGIAFILCLLFGWIGVHRYYMGDFKNGLFQTVVFGGIGVWAFIDLIRIAINNLKPPTGFYNDEMEL